MIVSMPQVAVNAAPVKAPVSAPTTPGQFSSALSQAAGNTQDSSTTPQVASKNGNSGRGNGNSKDSKSGTKTPIVFPNLAAMPVANLCGDTSPKIFANPSLSAFLSLLNPAAGQISDADASANSDGKSGLGKGATGSTLAGAVSCNISALTQAVPPKQSATASKQGDTTSQAASGAAESASAANTKPVNGSLKISSSAKENASDTSSVAQGAASKIPVIETKAPSHEANQSAEAGRHTTTATDQNKIAPQVFSDQLPPAQTLDVKPTAPQTATSSNSAGKSNIDAVPASSQAAKKDGDSTANTNSQSQKNDPSASAAPSTIKQILSDAQTQPAATSTANPNASAQIAQPAVDAKSIASATTRIADPAAKGAAQAPAAGEAESAAETAAAHLSSPIQVAKLVERAGQTELRVGIQAGEFGNVDIRTSMARSQFTAEISVERGELGRALSAELPALHNRLAEQRVPMANIVLQHHSASGNGSSDLRQGTRQQQYAPANQFFSADDTEFSAPVIPVETGETRAGLDLHM